MNIWDRKFQKSLLTSVICFLVLISVQSASPNPQPVSGEAGLRDLISQFFDAYVKEDLSGFMALWSENSPNFADRRNSMQGIFADFDSIQVKSITFVKFNVWGNKAKVRLTVELAGVEAKTGKPAQIFGKMDRTLYMVKEESTWKIWSYVPTDQEWIGLINALLKAETKAERVRLLNEEKDLATTQLVTTLYSNGESQARERKFDLAQKLNNLAFEAADFLGDKGGLAWSYMVQGNIFHYQSKYTSALENYQHALIRFQELNDKSAQTRTLSNMASIYKINGQDEKALETYEESARIARETDDKKLLAKSRLDMGFLYQKRNKHPEALAAFEESSQIAKDMADKPMQVIALAGIGDEFRSLRQYAKAVQAFEQMMEITKETEIELPETQVMITRAHALLTIGDLYRKMDKYAEALERYEESGDIAQKTGDKPTEASALYKIGGIHHDIGNYRLALEAFQKTLTLREALEDKSGIAYAMKDIGDIYDHLGNYDSALDFCQKSLRQFDELGDENGKAMALNNIGKIYQSTGEYAQALEAYEASLNIDKKLENKAEEANPLNNIGTLYMLLRRYSKALEAYKASLKIAKEGNDKEAEANVLNNIGIIFEKTGEYAKALEAYEESLKAFQELEMTAKADTVRVNADRIYKFTKEYAEPLKAAKKYKGFIFLRHEAYKKVIDYSELFSSSYKEFTSVVNYGQDLSKLDMQEDWDLDSITVKNPNYWRAIMDVEEGDPSIIFSNAYLCAIKGYIERAKIWLMLGRVGMEKKYYFDFKDLISLIEPIEDEIAEDIKKGIALHDQGKFSEAIKVYDEVIAEFPFSSWAYYEKVYSLLTLDENGNKELIKELYDKSLQCNPFRPESYKEKNQDIIKLFVYDVQPFVRADKKKASDLKRFAYGCEKLGLHDIAAHAFWILLSGRGKSDELMSHYLSNLGQLGLDSLVLQIDSEFSSEYEPESDRSNEALNLKAINMTFKQFYQQGKYEEALQLSMVALEFAKEDFGPNHINVAEPLNNLGIIFMTLGKYTEAEPLFKRALTIQEKALPPDDPNLAYTLNSLAALYNTQNRYAEAESHLQRVLKIWEAALPPDHPDLGAALNNLGTIYIDQHRYVEARPLIRRAIAIAERDPDLNYTNLAKFLLGLATIDEGLGKYPEARRSITRAQEIFEKSLPPNHPDVAEALVKLASCDKKEGKYDAAERHLKKAIEIREKAYGQNHLLLAHTLNGLAGVYEGQGKYAEAELLFKKSLAIRVDLFGLDHIEVTTPLNNLSRIYYFQGKYAEAETLLKRALEIREKNLPPNHPLMSLTLYNLAKAKAALNQPVEAIKLMRRSLLIDQQKLDNVFALSSEFEKTRFSSLLDYRYESLISLVAQKLSSKAEAVRIAMDAVLHRKGMVLEALSRERMMAFTSDNPLLKETAEHLKTISSRIASFVLADQGKQSTVTHIQHMTELMQQKQYLEEKLSRLSRTDAKERQSQRVEVNVEHVSEVLPPGSTLVEYLSYPVVDFHPKDMGGKSRVHHYLAFLLPAGQNTQPVLINLGKAEALDSAVHAFRQEMALSKSTINSMGEAEAERWLAEKGRKIYKMAFAPLKDAIGNNTVLYLAPDAELNLIPFGALQNEDGDYLTAIYQFNYIYTGRDLLHFTTKPAWGNGAVIIADPDYDLEPQTTVPSTPSGDSQSIATLYQDLKQITWKRLNGTRDEAEAIIKELPGFTVDRYMGSDALESIVKGLKSPQILHLATHGFFFPKHEYQPEDLNDAVLLNSGILYVRVPQKPGKVYRKRRWMDPGPLLRSGLIFAGANNMSENPLVTKLGHIGAEGILTAEEVSGLSLWGTDLVVLSACDTGVGDTSRGEGVFGLRRAFQLAGAKSVLMSLWRVDDVSTVAFMKRFYRNLNRDMTKVEALRETKQWMIKYSYHTDDNGAIIRHSHPYHWAPFILVGAHEQKKEADY